MPLAFRNPIHSLSTRFSLPLLEGLPGSLQLIQMTFKRDPNKIFLMTKYNGKEGKVLIKWVYSPEGSKYFISIPHFPLMESLVNFYDVEFIRWLGLGNQL